MTTAATVNPSFRRAVCGAAVGSTPHKTLAGAMVGARQVNARLPVLSAYRLPAFINRPPFASLDSRRSTLD